MDIISMWVGLGVVGLDLYDVIRELNIIVK